MSTPTPPPISPVSKAGFALLMAGVAAWVWLGDWRWAVMGLLALLMCIVASSTRTERGDR